MYNVNTKSKIAYVTTPITFGGSEKVNLNFIKNSDINKYHIHPVIIIRPWEETSIFEKELIKRNIAYSKVPVANNKKFDLIRVWRCYKHIRFLAKQNSVDLLHTHGYLADIVGLFVAKSLGIPIVSTCHGFVFRDLKLRIYFKLNIFALRFFNRIIAVSQDIKCYLVNNNINPSIITVIQNVADASRNNENVQRERNVLKNVFMRETNDLILGYIGRLSTEKGVRYLIEAVAILKSKHNAVKLLVIGEGPDLDNLQQFAKNNNIEDDVFFLGFHEDISPFWETMSIFVLPSLTEGTPLALLEAMSAKVPVVATRVGGVPDIIDNGVTGLLVNPCSGTELADAVIKLHNDNGLKMSIVNNASELMKNEYSINSWMAKIYGVYDELLS